MSFAAQMLDESREVWTARKFVAPIIFINILFIIALNNLSNSVYLTVMITILPLLLLAALNSSFILYLIPILVFVDIHPLGFAISEWATFWLIISVLFTLRDIKRKDLYLPIFTSVGVYLFILVISVFKAENPFLSLLLINHYILFIGIIVAGPLIIKFSQVIWNIGLIFMGLITLNSLHVIVQAVMTNRRVFGFAGVMFVDYVGLGIVILVIMIIFEKDQIKRIILSIMAMIFVIALVLTQTRTSWISTLLAVSVMLFYIALTRNQLSIPSGSIQRFILSSIIIIVVAIIAAMVFNPDTFTRITDIKSGSEPLISESGIAKNSLVTRVLIWSTGYNAFILNPILGIGAYSFPFSSNLYYTFSDELFNIYVKGLSPHLTFFAVIIETGIVGLIAFSFLLVSLLRFTVKAMKTSTDKRNQSLAITIGGCTVYIMISMFTTDAWLWGHGIIVFGLIVSLQFALTRIRRLASHE
ncbi:MAG: O-antigen ligase family protein [Bacteroidota bacterium]|jgi:O-antigen ligase